MEKGWEGGVSITEGRTGNYGNRAAIKSEIEMEERELERAVVQIESLLRHSNPRVFLLVDAPRTKFSLSLHSGFLPASFVAVITMVARRRGWFGERSAI